MNLVTSFITFFGTFVPLLIKVLASFKESIAADWLRINLPDSDGKDFDWQTKDKPRQVTSRIVVGLSSIVYFFLLVANVEGY
jgi:hypothetical protein